MLWAAERAEESKPVLGEAAALARRAGDGELLARVALSWRGGELRPILRHADHQFLALLREALTACPPGDSRLRCLLLASWARCAYWDISDRDGIAACDEAVAMARRLGDAEALTSALGTRFYYRWRPELVRERLAIAAEILAVAVAAGDSGLVAQARYFRLVALLDLGWLRDAWSELDRFEAAVAVSGQPTLKLRALWFRATRNLAQGDRKRADEVAARHATWPSGWVAPTPRSSRSVSRFCCGLSRVGLTRRFGSSAPACSVPSPTTRSSRSTNGLGGRPVEARASLDAVVAAGLERFPHDMSWLFARCGLLAAAAVSGDRGTGELLYDALRPFAGHWAVLNPGIMVVGAVDHYLGLGAALLGRLDDAVDHLRRAAGRSRGRGRGRARPAQPARAQLPSSVDGSGAGDDAEIVAIDQRITLLAARNTVPFKPLLPIVWSAADATPVRGAAAASRARRRHVAGRVRREPR